MSIDLLQEIQEELGREKIKRFFTRYARHLAVLLVVAVITIALGMWWNQHKKDLLHNEAAEYAKIMQALHSIKNKDSLNIVLNQFEKLSSGKTVYAVLAKINIANISDALGDYNKSIYYYGMIANDSKIDITFRSYANLMKAASSIRSQKITIDEAIEMIDGGKKIDEFAFSDSLNLLKASLLIENGKKDQARIILKSLSTSPNFRDSGIADLMLSLTY